MSPELWLRNICVSTSLVWCLCGPAAAQLPSGTGFDSTPLQLPSVPLKGVKRSITTMDLLTLRDIVGVSISPDAKQVAFVVQEAVYQTNSYRTGLFMVSTDNQDVVKNLGSVGMPHWGEINQIIPEAPQWSPDSRYITYRARWNSASTWQVWRWSVNGGSPIQLTRVPGDVEGYEWTADGSKILLDTKQRPDPSFVQQLNEHGILYDGSIYAWQGLPIVTEVVESKPTDEVTWMHDNNSGEETRATPEEVSRYHPAVEAEGQGSHAGIPGKAKDQLLDMKVSPDGRFVVRRYVVEDIRKAKFSSTRLFVKSLGGNRQEVDLTPTAYYVEQYWWSDDGSKIFYTEYKGDGRSEEFDVVPVQGGTPRRLYAGHDYLSGYSMDPSGAYVACTRETNVTPAQIALLSLRDGTLRTLVDVNPEFGKIRLSNPERIEGVNKYGDPWFGHVVKPLDYIPGKQYPLIVTSYRSGDWFLRGASGNENPIQVYAANGFVVLNMDVGKNPNVPDGDFAAALRIWSSPTASIEQAVQELCNSGIVDPKRVGITGYSHGSEIMAYAISHTDLFRAAIGGSGARDPYFYYMAGKTWHDIFLTWGLGGWPEGESRRRWKVLSPTLNANHIHVPLMENAADSEFIGDLALFTSLQELRRPAELFIYANELHVKNQPKHRLEIYERNLDWFRFWLKGEEDPDPAKKEQYKRWEHLRELQEKENDTVKK